MCFVFLRWRQGEGQSQRPGLCGVREGLEGAHALPAPGAAPAPDRCRVGSRSGPAMPSLLPVPVRRRGGRDRGRGLGGRTCGCSLLDSVNAALFSSTRLTGIVWFRHHTRRRCSNSNCRFGVFDEWVTASYVRGQRENPGGPEDRGRRCPGRGMARLPSGSQPFPSLSVPSCHVM